MPAMFIFRLMLLELPNLIGLLLPLGFYVALLLAYGRLYADSEMTVLHACGYGPQQLLKHSLIMAFMVASLVMVIVLWLSPMIAVERTKLLRTTGVQMLIKTIMPGHFRLLANGHDVFYVESMDRHHTVAKGVFLARQTLQKGVEQWEVLWADKAYAKTDPVTEEDYVVMKHGKAYLGTPGLADYRIAFFEQLEARLPHPEFTFKSDDLRTVETRQLWPVNNSDPLKAAEIQWRLSVPLMVLVLTWVGVPLSRVNPRVGKYAKLLPAIILFFVYANFMFITRSWIIAEKIPVWLGMWWLHGVVVLLGAVLLWRNRVRPA